MHDQRLNAGTNGGLSIVSEVEHHSVREFAWLKRILTHREGYGV